MKIWRKKNGLKVGDKVRLKSNLYDADNEKGANETVEVTIKGLFSGKNQAPLTYAQELYEDTLISDLDTAAKLYGNTVQTATYEDATFFAKGDQDLDQLIEKIKALDIDWNLYDLVKSSSNYPALQKSISSMFQVADYLFIGSLVFASLLLTPSPRLVAQCPSQRSGYLVSSGTLQGADCRAIRGRIGHDFHPSLPPLLWSCRTSCQNSRRYGTQERNQWHCQTNGSRILCSQPWWWS